MAPADPGLQMAWGLTSGGLAAVDAAEGALQADRAGSGGVTLVHDPWRPVPARGGHLGLDPGPCDRQATDRRTDVACFSGPVLDNPLTLEGLPRLRIRVRADQPSFDLCAALSRVRPSGVVDQLASGVGRFQGAAGEPTPVSLELQPLRASLEEGDRLRLSLAGSAWPQIAVNPGDGNLPAGPAGPRHRVITLELDLTEAELELLPFLPGELGAN